MTYTTYIDLSVYLSENNLIENELSTYVTFDEIGDFQNAKGLFYILYSRDAFNCTFYNSAAAIKWLMNNDPSLTKSLKLADDMGYEMSNLNSVELARILQHDMRQKTYIRRIGEIDKFFED